MWSGVPSGSYTLTATYVPQNEDNYTAKSIGSVSNYSITKQNQQKFSFAENTITKTYGDTDFSLSTQGGSGAVTFSVSGGSDIVTLNGNKVTIKKAGAAVITAVKAGGADYNETSASITIHINRAQSGILIPTTASDITVLGKLSSADLTGGKGNVDGTFVWTNPDLVVSATGEYDVTFTPDDLDDYLPCTGKVKVKVSPTITSSSSDVVIDLSGVTLPSGVTSVSLGSSQSSEGGTSYSAVFKLISGNASLDNLDHLALYDMKLLDQNGNPVENFTGKIKVKVKIPSGMRGNLHVLWYNPNSNTLTDMNAVQENGYLVFETTHFSFYAIAQLSTISSDSMGTNPDTGDENFPTVPLVLPGTGFAIGLTIMKKRLKFRTFK